MAMSSKDIETLWNRNSNEVTKRGFLWHSFLSPIDI